MHSLSLPVIALFTASLLVGCPTPSERRPNSEATPAPPPAPDAWGGTTGPGGPTVAFELEDLWEGCAYLNGGEEDDDHHNLVVPWDGYLLMPWAPEYSVGGISFFDMSAPCAPIKVGEGVDGDMRETHSMGFRTVDGRDYLAVNYHGGIDFEIEEIVGGIQIWDITDVANPFVVSNVRVPGYLYPDSYQRVTLSLSWQGPVIYVASADNGVHVIDATDPLNPEFVSQYTFEPILRLGTFHAMGNVGMAASAEGSRTVMMDISDPFDPQPLLGGEFDVTDGAGVPREYYFANLGGPWAMFARKEGAGGPIVYDVSDPTNPTRVGDAPSGGNGGYVFLQHDTVFVGESSFAGIYDFSDPANATQLGTATLEGDLDTATPLGNLVVLAVDDDSAPDQATMLVPWRQAPDTQGPTVGMTSPRDGDTFAALTSRVGLSFDEMVEPRSVFAGSFRVTDAEGWAVDGWFSAQENLVNFSPKEPLEEDTTYVVSVPAGGITDFFGNPTTESLSFRFSTGAEVEQ
ncbi:MAG: Ig-like domain-containing protein [Deltaproteobacteria bacterium]|nr:Ig-like domain-containing protein [Deltaproteobacteria bacterium]